MFASQFNTVPFERLGATPVPMSLGDVLVALQQGTIDGALTGILRHLCGVRPIEGGGPRRIWLA